MSIKVYSYTDAANLRAQLAADGFEEHSPEYAKALAAFERRAPNANPELVSTHTTLLARARNGDITDTSDEALQAAAIAFVAALARDSEAFRGLFVQALLALKPVRIG